MAAGAKPFEGSLVRDWPLLFKGVRVFFLGSDDFAPEHQAAGAHDLNDALVAGWAGPSIAHRFTSEEIATAHERVERPTQRGRVLVMLDTDLD